MFSWLSSWNLLIEVEWQGHIETESCLTWHSLIRLPLSFIADVMLVQPRVEFILSFIDHIAGDEDHTDGVVACAAGLIG